jgi:hypothetical protein
MKEKMKFNNFKVIFFKISNAIATSKIIIQF